MHWAVIPLLVTAVSAAAVDTAVETAEDSERDGKCKKSDFYNVKFLYFIKFISVFSIFQIVKFNNDHCNAIDGTIGTCYTASECTAKGGEERGNCASGFGVCCVSKSLSVILQSSLPTICRMSEESH